jgi:hypothetical protein
MDNWKMENAINSAAAKMKAEQDAMSKQAYASATQELRGHGVTGRDMGIGVCRSSLREEAENQVGYHRSEADKKDRAVAFFREHPEFDEFIQLIRSGVIGI